MINTIGYRESEKALQLGHLFTSEEALSVGLIDETTESEELIAKAEEKMQQWLKIPGINIL